MVVDLIALLVVGKLNNDFISAFDVTNFKFVLIGILLTIIYVKDNRLWITIHLDTKTKESFLVVQSKVNFIVREGGYVL
jgi:hypothetical protein